MHQNVLIVLLVCVISGLFGCSEERKSAKRQSKPVAAEEVPEVVVAKEKVTASDGAIYTIESQGTYKNADGKAFITSDGQTFISIDGVVVIMDEGTLSAATERPIGFIVTPAKTTYTTVDGNTYTDTEGKSFTSTDGITYAAEDGTTFTTETAATYTSTDRSSFTDANGIVYTTTDGTRYTSTEGTQLVIADGVTYTTTDGIVYFAADGNIFTTADGSVFKGDDGTSFVVAAGVVYTSTDGVSYASTGGKVYTTEDGVTFTNADGSQFIVIDGLTYVSNDGSTFVGPDGQTYTKNSEGTYEGNNGGSFTPKTPVMPKYMLTVNGTVFPPAGDNKASLTNVKISVFGLTSKNVKAAGDPLTYTIGLTENNLLDQVLLSQRIDTLKLIATADSGTEKLAFCCTSIPVGEGIVGVTEDITLEESSSLAGTLIIISESGKAYDLGGIKISLDQTSFSTATNADGSFLLRNIPASTWDVMIRINDKKDIKRPEIDTFPGLTKNMGQIVVNLP